MRSLTVLSILLLALSLFCGCYHNQQKTNGPIFKFDTTLTSSNDQPGMTEGVTLSFTLFNFTDTTFANVPWIIYLDGNTGDVVASGSISSIAGGATSNLISAAISAPSGGGSHTYTAYIDPNNNLNQRGTGSDVSAVELTFADFDLTINVPPSSSPATPTTITPITISFSVDNVNISGVLSTATNVGYQVLENGIVLVSGTIPAITANASVGVAVQLPLATAGLHEYMVLVNPGNVVVEQDYANNTMSVGVTVGVAN